MRLLVVDDDEQIVEFLALALGDEGHEVLIAAHGAQALEVLDRAGAAQPHLILLDMGMPVMDGLAFAAVYRQRAGSPAPIVVMTAAHNAAERAAQVGAAGVLPKPFELDALLALVARFAPRNTVAGAI